jgi:hypothetical protein
MNQNTTTTQTVHDGVQHSKPIPISTQHLRDRSASFSSDSSNSPTSSPPLLTPNNLPNTRIAASPSSPILYYLSQSSPQKAPATFPFRGFVPPPVAEDEPAEAEERPPPAHHGRRASTAGQFHRQVPVPELHHERGVNVLRRLSLGSHLGKPPGYDIPQPGIPRSPPHSVPSPPIMNTMQPTRKARRSATVTEPPRRRRAPSPMGERILKGHFDGFN